MARMPKIKIIRKVDIERQYIEMLKREQDYELASLSHAMKQNDEPAKEKSKKRLAEIHNELKVLGVKEYVQEKISKELAPLFNAEEDEEW